MEGASRMTCTCALTVRAPSGPTNPSATLESSMNFFHPQSCSFLQKRCRVSECGRVGEGGCVCV